MDLIFFEAVNKNQNIITTCMKTTTVNLILTNNNEIIIQKSEQPYLVM